MTPYTRTNEENKFIFTYYNTETSIVWRTFILYVLTFYLFMVNGYFIININKLFYFISDDDKRLNKLNKGFLNLNGPLDRYYIFPVINDNFAFINVSTTQYQLNAP